MVTSAAAAAQRAGPPPTRENMTADTAANHHNPCVYPTIKRRAAAAGVPAAAALPAYQSRHLFWRRGCAAGRKDEQVGISGMPLNSSQWPRARLILNSGPGCSNPSTAVKQPSATMTLGRNTSICDRRKGRHLLHLLRFRLCGYGAAFEDVADKHLVARKTYSLDHAGKQLPRG